MSSVVEELSVPVSRLSWNESILARLVQILQTALPGLSGDTASLILRRTVWESAAEEWEARMQADTIRLSVPEPPRPIETEVTFERVPTVAEIKRMLESKERTSDPEKALDYLSLPIYEEYEKQMAAMVKSVIHQHKASTEHSLIIPAILTRHMKQDPEFETKLESSIRQRLYSFNDCIAQLAAAQLPEEVKDPVGTFFKAKASHQARFRPQLRMPQQMGFSEEDIETWKQTWLRELVQKVLQSAWKLHETLLLPVWTVARAVCEEYNLHRAREKQLARTAVEHSAIEEEPEEWSQIAPVVFGTSEFRMNTHILDNVMRLLAQTKR